MRTQRLLLRPWVREDVDSLHVLLIAPEVRRYLWDDIVITRETVEQLVESSLRTASESGIGYWTVHTRPPAAATAPIAGFCGFRFIDDGPEIELMYGLRGEYWGKGLATEACLAVLDYLWCSTQFPRVYARTDPPNEKSVQVMLRLGMTRDLTTETGITYFQLRPA
jgi:[ribosomal protein S5]-alanine N-acetyltransferase